MGTLFLGRTAVYLTLSTHSYAMSICARALHTRGECVRGFVMRGGEGRGRLD